MLSAFSYADLRYGGTGSGNWAYGELAVGDAGTFVHVDHSSFTYGGSSGIKLGLYGSVDVSASTISNNGNGISANTASVNVSGHTVISNNSQNGLWFNLPTGYSTPTSSIVDSDVTGNGDNGIYIGANGDYPLSQMPWGTRDNIYGNAGGGTQLATSGYPGLRQRGSELDRQLLGTRGLLLLQPAGMLLDVSLRRWSSRLQVEHGVATIRSDRRKHLSDLQAVSGA
jgi:hypothetical protein